jgi:hypothetical protein
METATKTAETETERPVAYKPHAGPQTEFHTRDEDIVLFGGAKFPGKTHALIFEATRQIEKPQYKAKIIRRTFTQLQEIMDRASLYYPSIGGKWEGEERRWRFSSGATIGFGHCKDEISKENYQGQECAFFGFDQLEQFSASMFRFIAAQNRTADPDVQCYIRATANPGGVGHWWIKRKFIDGKKPFQKYIESFGFHNGKELLRSFCYVPATIFDNPTGLEANPQYLANLKSLPETEKQAYLHGNWNAFVTDCIFDGSGMAAQQKMVIEPQLVGLLEDSGEFPTFSYDEKGRLTIWKHPEPGRKYLITADVGKGANAENPELAEEQGDNPSAALVFDAFTREVVARWHGQIDPSDWGAVLFGLGTYYNSAIVAAETWPGPGIATGIKLKSLRYPRLYLRKKWDGARHVETEEVGWCTDKETRPSAIAALQFCIQKSRIILRDQLLIDECFNFIRKPRIATQSVRMEARSGCYDDLVVCAMIAAFIFENEPELTRSSVNQERIIAESMVELPRQKKASSLFRSKNPGMV